MGDWIREQWARRHWGLNLLLLFSAYMTFIYVPWDLFIKPLEGNEEVWFGIRFHDRVGWWLTWPHLFVYGAIAFGLWNQRPWTRLLVTLYAAQVTIAMVVWPLLYVGGFGGVVSALISGVAFGALTKWVWEHEELFEPKRTSLRDRYGSGGGGVGAGSSGGGGGSTWALVTGASAGIGAEFARTLARDGVNLVLTARREDRLKDLASELERRHGIETRSVPCDLSDAGARTDLVAAVADLEIDILINNAGFGYAGRFDKQDPERLVQMVRLNCEAPVALTAAFLPAMRQRARGAVIFVGSVAGSQPLPFNGLYSATKAFDNLLGEALWGELNGSGVDVLSLLPGPTESEFHELAGGLPRDQQAPPAAEVVEVAFEALGRKPSVIAGWFNWLRANGAARLLPRSSQALVAKGVIAKRTPGELQ